MSTRLSLLIASMGLVAPSLAAAQEIPTGFSVRYPALAPAPRTRGDDPVLKLSPDLRALLDQMSPRARGASADPAFSAKQLKDVFGIDAAKPNPTVAAWVRLGPNARPLGNDVRVYYRMGNTALVDVPVNGLGTLIARRDVVAVTALRPARIPSSPVEGTGPSLSGPARGARQPTKLANQFDTQGLTGKGVIIGIVDTGIDWTHPDFLNRDGTTRLFFLWDQTDESFEQTRGRIGSRPPPFSDAGRVIDGPGTLYTSAQINAALRGAGTVNSMDRFGHGTASAGTAAGNGLATANGIPAQTYAGVAPDADLIIVKVGDCGEIDRAYLLGVAWMMEQAKKMGRPIVTNLSFGGHSTAHDGRSEEELFLNQLVGSGQSGRAITVSAGNEGQFSIHARGRFGPRRPGQDDVRGGWINLLARPEPTEQGKPGIGYIQAYFDHGDDWGLVIASLAPNMATPLGKPIPIWLFKEGDQLRVAVDSGIPKPPWFAAFAAHASMDVVSDGKVDQVVIPVVEGSYVLAGAGFSERVQDGTFDVYAPAPYGTALFTVGAEKKGMVGSPGNAANVITVGAYDFRSSWVSQAGTEVFHNLDIGALSTYSSPGGPRADGLVKPDIVAPASFTISPLSRISAQAGEACQGRMGSGDDRTNITRDGYHLAWAGTSAAAPFTAGVIALMLQKNPTLDSEQIRKILIATAIRNDAFVGVVPNPEWGYGKLHPAAALAATPSPGTRP